MASPKSSPQDHVSQFTSRDFTKVLLEQKIKISIEAKSVAQECGLLPETAKPMAGFHPKSGMPIQLRDVCADDWTGGVDL